MKKINIFVKVFFVLIIALSVFSCENPFNKAQKLNKAKINVESTEYGTLYVNRNTSRALEIEKIAGATVSLNGSDMSTMVQEAAVSSGAGSATFSDIPVGKNRVVSVQAKQSIDNVLQKMDGVVMYAVTDINPGENSLMRIFLDLVSSL